MIEVNQTGVYITKHGVPIEKKPMFLTATDWSILWELSAASNTAIGNLIVKLAQAEHARLKLN